MNNNPIIVIDDSLECLELIRDCLTSIPVENEVLLFNTATSFLNFMKKTDKHPFFILCNINLAKLNGPGLKKKIEEDSRLRLKCIPFIFFADGSSPLPVDAAYNLNIQGYFIKPGHMNEMVNLLRSIIAYWKQSQPQYT
jgi:DNA-binding NtrC family response regulator